MPTSSHPHTRDAAHEGGAAAAQGRGAAEAREGGAAAAHEGGPPAGRWLLPALAALVALGAARDAALLLGHDAAAGTDGYYYALQVKQLLADGRLYYPTGTPLVFYLLAGVRLLTGDVIFAVKIGSVLVHALLSLGVYALVAALTRERRFALVAAALAAFGGMHLYLVAEFVKNSAALALLVWAAFAATRAATHDVSHGTARAARRRRALWLALSLALLTLAALSHRSAWAFIVAAPPLVLLSLRLTTPAGGHHDASVSGRSGASAAGLRGAAHDGRRSASFAWGAVVLLGLLPGLVAAQPFVELPAWLANEILARPRWPLGLSDPVGTPERLALLFAAPATLFLLARRGAATAVHDSSSPLAYQVSDAPPAHFRVAAGALALWTLLVTLNPFLVHDVREHGAVGRLDHLAYIQAAVLLPCLARLAARRVGGKRAAAALALAALALLAASLRAEPPKGLRPEFLSAQGDLAASLPAQRERLGERPFVLARHGDEFLVTWALGVPAQQKFPRDAGGKSIHWLLRRAPCRALTDSMTAVTEEGFEACSALVRHEDLPGWLAALDEPTRAALLAVNPHLREHLQDANTPLPAHATAAPR